MTNKARIEQQLQQWLPDPDSNPEQLHAAMHYVALANGKRLRPQLVYATGQSLGADISTLDIPAVAVELIHCYSLVHDDLPAMDDDDLRRGIATCHKQFDEATAILVGDALQSLAFELLTTEGCHPDEYIRLQMIKTLSHACGAAGMVGGQMLDLDAEDQTLTLKQLENMHQLKTGALIRACVRLGALAANCDDRVALTRLDRFATHLGLAFQIQDDILDVEGNTDIMGKTSGRDRAKRKATYPSIMGLDAAKEHLKDHQIRAHAALEQLPFDTQALAELCELMVQRQR